MRGLINGEIEVRRFPRASSSRGRASNVAARFWLKRILERRTPFLLGWETIGSLELFLAAAGERIQRIRHRCWRGICNISPSVHVAERMVQLDHLTNGRVIFGSGPGALTADARAFGIDPTPFRGRQDEALGVINRLLNGEHFKRSREAQLFDVCGRHLMLALPSLGLGQYLRVNDADA